MSHLAVMPALVAGIHVFLLAWSFRMKTWMAGTSPAMTQLVNQHHCPPLSGRQFKPSRAVTQLVHMGDIGLVQHGEEQIAHRRAVGIADMPSALDSGNTAGDEQERQIGIE